MKPSDYWVTSRTEQQIEAVARQWRTAAERRYQSDFFNMVDFIKDVVQRTPNHPDYLRIKFFDKSYDGPPARVSYKPATLSAHVDIWAGARDLNDGFCRYVLAHECGHLALHDHNAKEYSDADGKRIPQSEQLRSAEWQADAFADHFLMPTEIVERMKSAHDLAIRCGVELSRAESRMAAVKQYWLLHGQYHVDQCDRCFGYSTTRIHNRVRCTSCQRVQRLEL